MYRLAIIALPFFFLGSLSVSGQLDRLSTGTFSGTIIDDSLGYALASVHLWNESTRMGGVSNESGEFSIMARDQDTIVFSAIGYLSQVMLASSSMNQGVLIRLKQKKYEIDEVVVRRFRSYESFIYQVVNHDLPESEISELKQHMNITLTAAAVEADRERAIKQKLDGFGYSTPLGNMDREKAFKEKISALEKRKRVINAKFNRELVGDLTELEEDELTEFIAFCDFSDEYLYETDLYTIIDDLQLKLRDYQKLKNK